jgi:hypothetical protein
MTKNGRKPARRVPLVLPVLVLLVLSGASFVQSTSPVVLLPEVALIPTPGGRPTEEQDPSEQAEGRTAPRDREEQLALEEAQAGVGKEVTEQTLADPHYPLEKWAPMSYEKVLDSGKRIKILFWQNRSTGAREGFRFQHP